MNQEIKIDENPTFKLLATIYEEIQKYKRQHLRDPQCISLSKNAFQLFVNNSNKFEKQTVITKKVFGIPYIVHPTQKEDALAVGAVLAEANQLEIHRR